MRGRNHVHEYKERMCDYMRISEVYNPQKTARPNAVAPRAKANKAVRNEDSFTASSLATDFNVARRAVAAAPDVRADKIDDILSRINNGTYNVSADDVAGKILDQMG